MTTGERARARPFLRRLALGLAAWLSLAAVAAQSALPAEAQEALVKGQQAASAALATYDNHFLDRPLWREAIRYGEAARQAAPDRLEPYRFLGQVYSIVKWYSRAWDAWESYLRLGGTLNPQTRAYMVEVSAWLGNNSYAQQNYAEAVRYFERLHQLEPDSEEASQHLALSHLALGQPEAARPYLQALLEISPENARYSELLAQAEEQLQYGVEASNAYREGRARYEAGELADALLAFRQATELSSEFREAFLWAGRTSLELRRPQEAQVYYQRAVALDPSDGRAQQNLTLARNQSQWGIEAYAAYQRGVGAFAAGNVDGAQQAFEDATEANSRYSDAWAWLGRIARERQDLEAALQFYDRARSLAPGEASYAAQYQAIADELAQTEAAQRAQEEAARQAAEAAEQAAREEAAREEAARQAALQAEQAEPEPEVPDEATPPPADAEANTAPTPNPPVLSALPAAEPIDLLAVEHVHRSGGSASGGAYSFFAVPSRLSEDLLSPVNYAGGTVFQRLEVRSKPSDAPVQYQLCLVPDDEIVVRPACSTEVLEFSAPGVYETRQALSSFSEYDSIDWSRGLINVMLVLKDEQGQPLDNTYLVGRSEADIDLSRYYPMSVRYEAVLVPTGATFQGW